MRTRIVAGNWKMNKNFSDGLALVSEIVNMYKDEITSDVKAILIPPFLHINAIHHQIVNIPNMSVGAQNCHQEDSGAFTGEISADMLKSVGAEYVILGHSERRQYFDEDEVLLSMKLRQALNKGLTPIYCVGETREEREQGVVETVIQYQLQEALKSFSPTEIGSMVIAYEPVWAIGTGLTATPEQAQEVHAFIRSILAQLAGLEVASQISILYGGSVNAANASTLFSMADIDGGLVGGASLKSRDFITIVKSFA